MVRKLIKSLLSLSLIAPLSVYALGLGDVQLHSALGERLEANIELLSVTPAEANNISVSLASQDTFDKVGLDRPAILMFLQFEVEQNEVGEHLIKVISREPINEPFLDFLVEVNWKSGRVLREYTLLLDPPGGYTESVPSVTAPATTAATAPEVDVADEVASDMASASEESTAVVDDVETADSSETDEIADDVETAEVTDDAMEADTVATTSTDDAATGAAESAVDKMETATLDGSLVYGPVKANDTLWAIANKLRPNDDVSVQQMMMALIKANPYAFSDNNINRLKRGYVLRIDDPSILNSLSKADAAREVAVQTRAWQDYRESVAARAKQRPAEVSAVEPTPGVATASKKEPKLKLVSPKGKGDETASAGGSGEAKTSGEVSEELMLAMESSAAQSKENAALKKRLSALEGQLEDMENIINLKDADLKALQDQLRKQGTAAELPVKPTATEMAAEKPELVVKPDEKVAAVADPIKPEAAIEPKIADTTEDTKPVTGETVAPIEAAKPVEAKKPEVKKPVKKKPKVVTPPPPPKSFIEGLLEDSMMLGIIGGVVLFVLILIVVLIKRRRKGGFQESILNVGGTSSMMKASDEQGSETSFLSDLAISGMGPGTIQTDEGEADPITEAEVFMAYGRNQQAEEVLKKAREVSPERTDIAAKLLEVYYSSKDSENFEALAEDAVGALQGDDALWGKVLAMGHELCPANVLFAGGSGTEAPTAATDSGAGDVMDIGLDLDELSAEMEGDGGGDMDLDLGLDFDDIDEGGSDTSLEEAPSDDLNMDLGDFGLGEPEAAAEESSDLDMDLGALDLDAGSEVESADDAGLDFDMDLGASDEAASDEGTLDFDLDLGASDDASDEIEFDLGVAEDESATAPDDELGFDLDMGELTTDEGAADMSLDMDMGDMDLGDLGGSAEVADDSISLDLDSALDDLGDFDNLGDLGDLDSGEDEMTTKLDLAQAYAEMGDAEGARSMLQEVVAGGSDEQQQQAQALIDKL